MNGRPSGRLRPGGLDELLAVAPAHKGFTWTDLPRSSLPNLVTLFGKAADASVKQLRIVPPTYPSYLTTSELLKIKQAVAALLGVAPPPTPSIDPSSGPAGTPGSTPAPTPTHAPAPTHSPPPPTEPPDPTESPGPT